MYHYLSFEEVMKINKIVIELSGGKHQLTNENLLESAVIRPQMEGVRNPYYKDIYEKTAAIFESLLLNHCFLDGNKRTALAAAEAFLHINSYGFHFADDAAEKFIYDILAKKLQFPQMVIWIKQHTVKI